MTSTDTSTRVDLVRRGYDAFASAALLEEAAERDAR